VIETYSLFCVLDIRLIAISLLISYLKLILFFVVASFRFRLLIASCCLAVGSTILKRTLHEHT
jgi:hypothetical protein